MKKNHEETAGQILELIGGRENISSFTHCITRLRFNVRDKSRVREKEIEEIREVLGFQWSGEQLQIIIGPHVKDVYSAICRKAGLEEMDVINENLDVKDKLTWKTAGSKILEVLSGSFVPLIPIIVVASLIKMFAILFGPDMLHVISAENDLYILFTFVGDAGFYFLPVFMGYTAAKKIGVTPTLGMFAGAILLHPTLIGMTEAGTAFSVYGIPMTLTSYSSTTIPVLLIVWIMSYVEKLFNKIIPDSLKMILSPLLTMLVMLPVELCIIGPLGTLAGEKLTYICMAIASLGAVASILISAFMGAFWNIFVLTGMHLPLIFAYINVLIAAGQEGVIGPAISAANFAVAGMAFGAALKLKDRERKLALSYFITHAIGGITEPEIFGIGIRYKRPFICACIGGAIGAVYYTITGTLAITMPGIANFMSITTFIGGTRMNFINGLIGAVISFLAAAAFTFIWGLKKSDTVENENEWRR